MYYYYCVYILSSKSRVLYTGITNNLKRRMYEHKNHLNKGFTDKYNIDQLVYYERFACINKAITREKQIKSWRREKKINLIESINPQWNELSNEL